MRAKNIKSEDGAPNWRKQILVNDIWEVDDPNKKAI
jgi:hypothetical protein